jgi:hypothetical protein
MPRRKRERMFRSLVGGRWVVGGGGEVAMVMVSEWRLDSLSVEWERGRCLVD